MRRVLLAVLLAGCAKSAPPLPGDSIGPGGAVSLSPKSFSTTPAPQLGAIESQLFAPEIIMEHQTAIGVTPAQKDAISKEVQRTQGELLVMQWDLNDDKEKLVTILGDDHVDEAKASAQAARLMDDEDKIKAAHLAMLVRIKNVLSPEQQKKLRELRGTGAAR